MERDVGWVAMRSILFIIARSGLDGLPSYMRRVSNDFWSTGGGYMWLAGFVFG
jgi:hypothetical protein